MLHDWEDFLVELEIDILLRGFNVGADLSKSVVY
jgi:hypothetical protein